MSDVWATFNCALLLAYLSVGMTRPLLPPRFKSIIWVTVLLLFLLPVTHLSLAGYLRVLSGDLSITTTLVLLLLSGKIVLPDNWPSSSSPFHSRSPQATIQLMGSGFTYLSMLTIVAAVIVFPSALGWTQQDTYSHGYYPTALGLLLSSVFVLAIISRWHIVSLSLICGWAAFGVGLLDSDNLWDYLIDPVGTVLLISHLITRTRFPNPKPDSAALQITLSIAVIGLLLFSIFLDSVNPAEFRFRFTAEDGLLEWLTVLVLASAAVVSLGRFRRSSAWQARGISLLLLILCIFGAGEELSWGQRLLGWDSPAFFEQHNAQAETNLHNLTIGQGADLTKINRLVFGTGLALMLAIYLFIMTPCWHYFEPFKRLVNTSAIPIPTLAQIFLYLVVIAAVELLISSSKRGEVTELAGSLVFLINLTWPRNSDAIDFRQTTH